MLEAVYTGYNGDKNTPDFKAMEVYLKRVWFSNGIHHHYGSEKFVPGFTPEFFRQAVQSVDALRCACRRTDCGTTMRGSIPRYF